MAKGNPAPLIPSVATTPATTVDDVRALIDDVFSKLQSAGALASGSVDLDVSAGDTTGRTCRVALKVTGGVAEVPAAAALTAIAPFEAIPEFNAEGHHVIALVMEKDLETHSPATLAKVRRILDAVDREIREAATFPDDIRNAHPETKPFHFIDIPFEE